MRPFGHRWLLALAACAATAWGAPAKKEPHIGYLFPGGGQRGSVVTPRHLDEGFRRVGPVRALGEPLGEKLKAAPPLLVRLRREQHRA